MLNVLESHPELQRLRSALDSDLQARIDRELKDMYKSAAFPDLRKDADALFAGRRQGHMLRHVFNDLAMPLFDAFTKEVPEYLATEEIDLIHRNIPYLETIGTDLRAHANGGDTVTVIELGTGKKHAQEFKTVPTVAALKPDAYIGVDFSPGSALEAMIAVKDHFAKAAGQPVDADMRIRDFMIDDFRLEKDGPRAFLMLGNTLANLEGSSETLPHSKLNQFLTNIRVQMREGDYLLLSMTRDQSEDTSYRHALFHEFHRHFLTVMKKALPDNANLRPRDFDFFVRWDPSVSNHVFGYSAKRDGWVRPLRKGPKYKYKKGDEFITCNSWRFDQGFLTGVYNTNDFDLKTVLGDPQGRVKIDVLQARTAGLNP